MTTISLKTIQGLWIMHSNLKPKCFFDEQVKVKDIEYN